MLMHDGVGPGARRDDCAPTFGLIEPLVAELRSRALEPAVLDPETEVEAPLIEHEPPVPPEAHAAGDADLAVVAEDRLERAELVALGALLADGFPRHAADYRERAWRTTRPAFRVLAREDGCITGQISCFRIATAPERVLFGIGDAVVAESARGRGVAGSVVELAVAECRRRGAEVVLTDTLLLRGSFRAVGFEAVPRFAFYYQRGSSCRWHRHWMAWLRDGAPPPRLRLEQGDF
jgi:predicted N-acetyltransferase YhbS